LIKTGERLGIPVQLTLVGPEHTLYDTDQAIRASQSHTDQLRDVS
jgi:hypothetical protein